MKKPLLFLYSHPIQYFAPMLKAINTGSYLGKISAWYCSRKGLDHTYDVEFGVPIKWDIPLLEGYNAVFLSNKAFRNSGFWSLMNWSVIQHLKQAPSSIIIVHGWNYWTHMLTLMLAKSFGHQVGLRAETPLNQELRKSSLKLNIRRFIFKYLLFPRIDYFLYIGQQNKAFYQHYGVSEDQLIFTPYAVDNERFQKEAKGLLPQKNQLRKTWNIPTNQKVILFSGKFISKKRPMDLLETALLLREKDYYFIFMGEGELRIQMEAFIAEHQLKNIFLTGFINQSKVSEFYALADAFVMCSQDGETWGLSTNEAMNFGLPIIISDLTGCADDLVIKGKTGYVFSTGNSEELAKKLQLTFNRSTEDYRAMSKASQQHITQYSYQTIAQNLANNLQKT